MRFTKSYEPGEFEPNIYALWEKTGAFQPKEPVYNSDESDTENCYSLVMPPPNANGNLHIGHGLSMSVPWRNRGTRVLSIAGTSYIVGCGSLSKSSVVIWSYKCGLWVRAVLGRI